MNDDDEVLGCIRSLRFVAENDGGGVVDLVRYFWRAAIDDVGVLDSIRGIRLALENNIAVLHLVLWFHRIVVAGRSVGPYYTEPCMEVMHSGLLMRAIYYERWMGPIFADSMTVEYVKYMVVKRSARLEESKTRTVLESDTFHFSFLLPRLCFPR